MVALKPLYDLERIEHIVVSTYQSVSGKGHEATKELWENTRALASGQAVAPKVFPGQIAMNLISDWPDGGEDYLGLRRTDGG